MIVMSHRTGRIRANDSLFYYNSSENWTTTNDLNFRPQFLDDLLQNATESERQEAKTLCGDNKMCLFDKLATGDDAIGAQTMSQQDENTKNMEEASKHSIKLYFAFPTDKKEQRV